jgi:hypothetical protein
MAIAALEAVQAGNGIGLGAGVKWVRDREIPVIECVDEVEVESVFRRGRGEGIVGEKETELRLGIKHESRREAAPIAAVPD